MIMLSAVEVMPVAEIAKRLNCQGQTMWQYTQQIRLSLIEHQLHRLATMGSYYRGVGGGMNACHRLVKQHGESR